MTGAAGFGVYVHVPFCRARCTYCDFNTYTGAGPDLQRAYYRALIAEWEARALPDGPVLSIFFGGGTPSLAPAEAVAAVIGAVTARRPLAAGAEITMEMNPGTVSRETLHAYRRAGVNRVSLGVQAAQDHHLARLNRHHSFTDAAAAVRLVRAAGFDNLNLDAIYGLPGQTPAEWTETVLALAALGPEHLSLYQLQVEAGTPLWRDVRRARQRLPDPDAVADMADWAEQELPRRGWRRYEVSNYAVPGRESVHNQLYWTLAPYIGLGAGAHSFEPPRRRWNVRSVTRYVEAAQAGRSPEEGGETLTRATLMGEYVWLGLRRLAGISESAFQRRFGVDVDAAFPGVVAPLIGDGLLTRRDGVIRATDRGLSLLNRVAAAFLEAAPTAAERAPAVDGGGRSE